MYLGGISTASDTAWMERASLSGRIPLFSSSICMRLRLWKERERERVQIRGIPQ